MSFDYFYGNEHEHYLHIQIPLMLIKDEAFKHLSGDSKLLYGLLLNRTSLSIRNGWRDEYGRVYIIYTIDEIMSDINCATQKTCKLIKELENIGLIVTVRRGLNKPNIIYVKNFNTGLKYQYRNKERHENTDYMRSFENQNSGVLKIKTQELPESKFKSFENQNGSIFTINNTDINNIDASIPSYPIVSVNVRGRGETDGMGEDGNPAQEVKFEKGQKKEGPENAPSAIQCKQEAAEPSTPMYDYDTVEEIIKGNIDYENMIENKMASEGMLDEIVSVVTSTICAEYKDGYISMGEQRMPASVVRGVFFKLDFTDVEYFMECFNRQTEPITKLTPYIRASLFRNHGTIGHHYQNRVNVDMPELAGRKIGGGPSEARRR